MFRLFLYPLTISRKNLLSVVFDFPKKVWTFYGSFSLSSKLKVDVSSVYPQVEKINPLRGLLIKMFNHVLIHWNRGRGGKHVGADERRDDKGSILLELIHYHFHNTQSRTFKKRTNTKSITNTIDYFFLLTVIWIQDTAQLTKLPRIVTPKVEVFCSVSN